MSPKIKFQKIIFYSSYTALLLTLVVVYEVLTRYLLRQPDMRAMIISTWLSGLIFLLGLPYVTLIQGHVKVDVIYNKISSKKIRLCLDLLTALVMIIVCSIVTYFGFKRAWASTLMNEVDVTTPLFKPPLWWYRWIVAISFCLTLITVIVTLLRLKHKLT